MSQSDQPDAVVSRFEATVARALKRLVGSQPAIALAISGGADSLSLLYALAAIAARFPLGKTVACVVDHQLRPESSHEAADVIARATALGFGAEVLSAPIAAGAGLEERARDARYAALESARLRHGLAWIATAHTGSDQAETVLMRLARGASLKGAGGIPESRGRLCRPLLGVIRAETEGYLKALGQPWHEDAMNADPQFTRVRIRRELLPAYERVAGPGVAQHLSAFARWAREDEAWFSAETKAALERLAFDASLDAVGVRALGLPIRRRVMSAWLNGQGVEVDARTLDDCLAALVEGRNATLSGDRLLCVGERLSVERAPPRS